MKVVLIKPNLSAFSTVEPPLGLAYLSAAAIKNGHKVAIIDAHAEDIGVDAICARISKSAPDVVGIYSTTPQIYEALDIARKIKESSQSIFIVFGGPHPTVLPDEALSSTVVDAVIRDEGVIIFKNLLDTLDKKRDLGEIKGLSWAKQTLSGLEIIHNQSQPLVEDLDSLPFPNWDPLNFRLYRSPTKNSHPYLPIVTTLGCPYHCIYCFQAGRQFRLRSPYSVVNEIEYLIRKYGIKEVEIIDDNFTLNLEHATGVCEEIISRKIKIAWNIPGGIRVDRVSEKLIDLMKKAGCYALSFGVESGSQKVLSTVQKEIDLEQTRKAVSLVKKAGIRITAFVMIGFPYERKKDMMQTINFVRDLDVDYAQFQIAVPYPRTQLYELVEKEGRFLTRDWSKFDRYSGETVFELGISKEEIKRIFKRGITGFYLRPRFLIRKIFFDPINFIEISRAFFYRRNVLEYLFSFFR